MRNNFEKISSIEQQIEKLKEKQKMLEQQMQQNIGQEVLKTWNIESEQEAIEWIHQLAGQVNGEPEASEQPEQQEEPAQLAEWDRHEQRAE
ncbi:hypothetical protein [Planococcus lenghuensis]|uniref:Uncharacterized protein n=1 Tax=Planococcus lenghuensis TaxID=2213202 RepID=A0A1Q2L575_9BACL|nr:hypothetical protein [Planococcus lenghuensis]AQQ55579.1 hypothetical protein B0X71_20620 [Planococcus lenghuensis]